MLFDACACSIRKHAALEGIRYFYAVITALASICECRVDQLFAFFIQWSPNLCDDNKYADEQGFIVVSHPGDNLSTIDDLPPRDSRLCRSTSFGKDWEVSVAVK